MELAAAAKVLSCHVVLLCLLSVRLCSGIHDTDSLNCNLIVNYRELHGQCSVNGNRLLQFGDGKQEGDATELCPDLLQSLKDTLEVMWSLQSGNDALHVTIESKYKQGEFSNRCWAIIKVGQQCCFYIDPLQMTWRESHSDASSAKEPWKNDKELKTGLRNILMGDFSHCLKKLLPHSREMQTLTTIPVHVDQPSSRACTSKPSVLLKMPSCLLYVFTIWFLLYIF